MKLFASVLLLLAICGWCVAAQQCNTLTSCSDCASQTGCEWCSLSLSCIETESACPLSAEDVNFHRGYNLSSCEVGLQRVSDISQCSKFSPIPYVGPFSFSFAFTSGNGFPLSIAMSGKNMEFSSKNTTLLDFGPFVVSGPAGAKRKPLVGYYEFHGGAGRFLGQSIVSIEATDFTIIGAPGNYIVGVVAMVQVAGKVQCHYVHSKEIELSAYYNIIINTGTWTNIGFFVAVFLIMGLITCCCGAKLKEPFNKDKVDSLAHITQSYLLNDERHYTLPLPSIFTKNRILNMISSFFFAPKDAVIKNVGASSLIFFRFQYVVIFLAGVMTLLSCGILLPLYMTSDQHDYFTDIAKTTVASIYDEVYTKSWKYIIYCVMTVVFFLLALSGMSIIYLQSKTIVSVKKDLHRNTVMIKKVHKSFVDNELLLGHFRSLFGPQQVLGGSITLKNSKRVQGTGYAFVVFASHAAALQCIKYYKSPRPVNPVVGDWTWRVSLAPAANDINWDNIEYSTTSKKIRGWIGFFIIATLVVVSCIATSIAKTIASFGSALATELSVYQTLNFVMAIPNFFMFNLLPTLIAVVNELVVPFIHGVAGFEKHKTHSGRKRSVLKYLLYYLYFNSIVIPFVVPVLIYLVGIVHAKDIGFDRHVKYYNLTCVDVIMLILGQTFAARAVPFLLQIAAMLWEYIRTKKVTRPPFDYEGNYAFKIMVLLLVTLYGPQMPLVSCFGLLYFTVSFFIDRYLILYLHSKQETDSSAVFLDTVVPCFGTILVMSPLYLIWMLLPVIPKTMYVFLATLSLVIALLVLMNYCFNVRVLRRFTKLRPVIVLSVSERPLMQANGNTVEEEAVAAYKSPYNKATSATPTTPTMVAQQQQQQQQPVIPAAPVYYLHPQAPHAYQQPMPQPSMNPLYYQSNNNNTTVMMNNAAI